MPKRIPRPRLAIAGPGAGKTHAMVDEIVAATERLPPHRFLAAITYTNAATNTIRDRLAKQIQTKRNIFVGTTHSFVNRFILGPYAVLMSLLPDDCVYAAIDVHEKGTGAANYARNLMKKGIVPYDQMIPTARKILKMPGVRSHLCGRLAYLFVDEFQDADNGMLEVFDQIKKGRKTEIYVVGDPEQYVMSFTHRGHSPPAFNKIPFFRFAQQAIQEPIVENHRSNGEIVAFANQFREDLQQKAEKPCRNEARVIFIPDASLPDIIARFQEMSAGVEIVRAPRRRLYLSEENATFDGVRDKFQLSPISNTGRKRRTLLGDVLELISIALDRNQRKARQEFKLSQLKWRATGIRLLTAIRNGQNGIDQLTKFITDEFGHTVSRSRFKALKDGLDAVCADIQRIRAVSATELYSSIRKAKGLQADATLVVAKSLVELKKWLQTDYSIRVADKQDKCRLGYVAFTRPREMLCIACLSEVDNELKIMLDDLRVVIAAREC